MPHDAEILGLTGYEIKDIRCTGNRTELEVRYTGRVKCIHCGGLDLRKKDRYIRRLRHESWGRRHNWILLEGRKFQCKDCGRYFNQRFPGILPRRRSTEVFRRQVFWEHYDGINRKRVAQRQRIGAATVERWFLDHLRLRASMMKSEPCPTVLGIDEHFFSRKKGFATTLCDLKNHKVYDVVLGRSKNALDGYFRNLEGKENVRVVCIDLAANYRALIRKHFPHARIVADRFHVVRLVLQHFMATWRELDPNGSKNRGLRSLMRRHGKNLNPEQKQRLAAYFEAHPLMGPIYEFKERLCRLLNKKTCTAKRCRRLIPKLLDYIQQLRTCGLEHLETLGKTLYAWSGEVAAMWRFKKNNGITEGFHNKMEAISRAAYGYRNFANYRLRIRVMCA